MVMLTCPILKGGHLLTCPILTGLQTNARSSTQDTWDLHGTQTMGR
jgi:hypothetical protein